MWVIVSILGDPLLQSVTTTKSKNNDFLTRCSLLLFVKNKYFVIPRLKFFHKELSKNGEGGKEK
jgi:hypothetical protein